MADTILQSVKCVQDAAEIWYREMMEIFASSVTVKDTRMQRISAAKRMRDVAGEAALVPALCVSLVAVAASAA